MAELHQFKDDYQNKKTQVNVSKLDENFRTVRLKVSANCDGVFEINQNKGAADLFTISPPDGVGPFIIGCQDGVLVWLETEEC